MMNDKNSLIAFAVYRPHEGKTEALLEILKAHIPALRSEGLITDRKEMVMQAEDGSVIEIFEWADAEASGKAHQLPSIQAIWGPIGEVAEFTGLASLPNAQQPFPHFKALN